MYFLRLFLLFNFENPELRIAVMNCTIDESKLSSMSYQDLVTDELKKGR